MGLERGLIVSWPEGEAQRVWGARVWPESEFLRRCLWVGDSGCLYIPDRVCVKGHVPSSGKPLGHKLLLSSSLLWLAKEGGEHVPTLPEPFHKDNHVLVVVLVEFGHAFVCPHKETSPRTYRPLGVAC